MCKLLTMSSGTCRNQITMHLWIQIICLALILKSVPAAPGQQNIVSTNGDLFLRINNVQFIKPDREVVNSSCVEHCSLLCQLRADCLSASYHVSQNRCFLNKRHLQSEDGRSITQKDKISFDKDFVYLTMPERHPWRMVFRAETGLSASLYDAWNDNTQPSEDTAVSSESFGCLLVSRSFICNGYYRSTLLNKWQNIAYAMFTMYSYGRLRAFVTFDGAGANSWNELFKIDRIVSSSIDELVTYIGPHNSESISGNKCGRRFSLTKSGNGCTTIAGWFFVSDQIPNPVPSGCCSFDNPTAGPIFRYSDTGYAAHYHTKYMGYADLFAVFISNSTDRPWDLEGSGDDADTGAGGIVVTGGGGGGVNGGGPG